MREMVDGYCRLLKLISVLCLAAMVVLVFGNVVLRYAFNSGITVSEEVSRWLFLWMTFLGAIVALREHAHLGTDMLVERLPAAAKKLCLLAGQALMLYVTWLILKGSWMQTAINLEVQAPVTGASMAIVYGTGVLFAVSAGALIALELWRSVTGQVSDAELSMVQDSEELAQVRELRIGESDAAAPGPARSRR